MTSEISNLQKEFGIINSLISSEIEKSKREVNSFLKLAGFNYEFDIISEGDEKDSITILKYINSNGKKIDVDEIEKHLSWGEKNAFSLVLFMYYAISKKADLIILDDPISSFDGNKKYAIINRLFSNKGNYQDSFYNKTVLLLTHDFEPIIDFGINHKPTSETNMFYLKNNDGIINEQKINVSRDVLSTIKFYYNESINNNNNIISRICFLRKYIEHTSNKKNSENNAYNRLSSLIHGRNPSKKIDDSQYICMNLDEVCDGENWINNFIRPFNSLTVLKNYFNNEYILDIYSEVTNDYIKVQLFRVYIELSQNRNKINDKNSNILKYIDEIYHIENDYIFTLNLLKFSIIPNFIIKSIDDFMANE